MHPTRSRHGDTRRTLLAALCTLGPAHRALVGEVMGQLSPEEHLALDNAIGPEHFAFLATLTAQEQERIVQGTPAELRQWHQRFRAWVREQAMQAEQGFPPSNID